MFIFFSKDNRTNVQSTTQVTSTYISYTILMYNESAYLLRIYRNNLSFFMKIKSPTANTDIIIH